MKRIAIAIMILAFTRAAYSANELQINYPAGATVIATVTNAAGQWFDTAGDAFETYNTLTDYDIAMTDQGNGEYRGTMDSGLPAGTYTVHFHSNSNVVPFAHHYNFYWSGTAVSDPAADWVDGGRLDLILDAIYTLADKILKTLRY